MKKFACFVVGLLVVGLSTAELFGFSTRICNNTNQEITVKLRPSHGNCPAGITQAFTISASSSTNYAWENWQPRVGGCMLEAADNSIEVNGASLPKSDIRVDSSYNSQRTSETIVIESKGSGFAASLLGGAHVCSTYIWRQGDYLAHGTSPTGTISFKNLGKTSVFVTSDQGSGYQAEIPANTFTGAVFLGSQPKSLLECQKPVGFPTSCVSNCPTNLSCKRPALDATFDVKTPNYNLSGHYGPQDTLNEQNSLGQAVDYVYLDTLVNNTNVTFDMAITTAPLYYAAEDPDTHLETAAPGTIAYALANGDGPNKSPWGFINQIYSAISQSGSQPTISLGGQTYPITFLSSGYNAQSEGPMNPDGRFTLYGKNQHDPAANRLSTKRHMALMPQITDLYPSLALGAYGTSSTYQTIILYARDPLNSCQPVIFIGRDARTNVFYALTYLLAYELNTGQMCCQTNSLAVCDNDTLYCPSGRQMANGCSLVTANVDSAIGLGQPARLKVTIDPIPNPSSRQPPALSDFGWASKIEMLPGLWWPGQPDFVETITPAPLPMRKTVSETKASSQPPPAKK